VINQPTMTNVNGRRAAEHYFDSIYATTCTIFAITTELEVLAVARKAVTGWTK